MNLYFAPLKGLTDAHFRSFYFKHFGGFDFAVAPFLLSSEDDAIKNPVDSPKQKPFLIPQLLGNRAENIIHFSHILKERGFTSYNLNLGCPAPVVIKKSKGAALLADPDFLWELLCELNEKSILPFSIKTRLGYRNQDELLPQLSRWKTMGKRDLIIHARSASQMYRGKTDWERFAACAETWEHPVIYNGDITSLQVYNSLIDKLGNRLSGVMIGRGIFGNPFIAEEIQKGIPLNDQIKAQRFLIFHRDISGEMSTRSKSFARLKGLWSYFAEFARLSQEELNRLKRLNNPEEFCLKAENHIIRTYQL
jgi:tRNA-dihydrouridine synthase B